MILGHLPQDKNSYKSTEAIDVGMDANMHVSKYKKPSGFEKSTLVAFLERGAMYIVFLMKLCSCTTMVDANKTTNDFRTNFQIKGIIDAYNTVNKM